MSTYTKSRGGSVGAGQDKTYEFDAITIPDSEEFYRCKVENQTSSYASSLELRGNAQTVFGRAGWGDWSTDKSGINWSKSGDAPKVKTHNTSSTTRSWTLKVTLETNAKTKYDITVRNTTGGTVTANKASTWSGDTVTLTVTPAANYRLASLSVTRKSSGAALTVTNNTFVMQGGAVYVDATWAQTAFAITKAANPSGAGTVSGSSSAVPGTSVTVTQSQTTAQAAEYRFSGWSISTGSITSGGVFTMPSSAVTVTANYQRRSTGTLSSTNLTAGSSVVMSITSYNSAFSHKYRIYKSGTNITTNWVSVAAGTTSVTVSIPRDWCNYVTTSTTATDLVCELQTYTGSTQIGSTYTMYNNLVLKVPTDVVPTLANITPAVERTIGGTTYYNVGDVYVQGHCGVSITGITATGAYSSTITGITVSLSGYSGSSYTKTFTTFPASYTSGLLTIAGSCLITVTATDSRGRTDVKYADITVAGYTPPQGSLSVWRVDSGGDDSDVGEYAKYSKTSSCTAVGSNAIQSVTLGIGGDTETISADTGDILPVSRKQINLTQEYTVTMTITDRFETTTITAKLPSAKFIIYVDKDGDRIAFMKAANMPIPTGKDSTLEISGDTQVYIGNDKLGDAAIHNVANNLTTTAAGNVLDARQGKALNDKFTAKEFIINAGSNKKITLANNSRIEVLTFGGAAAVCGRFEVFVSSTGAIVNSTPTASSISVTKTTNEMTIANGNSSVNTVVKIIVYDGSAT